MTLLSLRQKPEKCILENLPADSEVQPRIGLNAPHSEICADWSYSYAEPYQSLGLLGGSGHTQFRVLSFLLDMNFNPSPQVCLNNSWTLLDTGQQKTITCSGSKNRDHEAVAPGQEQNSGPFKIDPWWTSLWTVSHAFSFGPFFFISMSHTHTSHISKWQPG